MTRFAIPAALSLTAALLPAPAARAGDWGGLFSAVMLASDYRYQGVSNSNNGPAMQGYVHWWRPDNWYAGVFATQVDYGYAQGPDFELDLYAGRHFVLDGGRTRLTGEVMATVFPDDRTPGPTLNFVQVKAVARRTEGPWTFAGAASFVPEASYGGGRAWRLESEAHYAVRPGLKAKALAGRAWRERGVDRSYWSLGAEATWKTVTVEVKYQDTDLSKRRCGFNPDVCGPALVGVLTVALPPIL
ncbi:TorF family putative porin [Phenylobacterium sp.]|uniref:TorF family putative porin n=1 Tax=Phenylobacterium sp. TaxID=1871053 RepID=UPI00301C6D30